MDHACPSLSPSCHSFDTESFEHFPRSFRQVTYFWSLQRLSSQAFDDFLGMLNALACGHRPTNLEALYPPQEAHLLQSLSRHVCWLFTQWDMERRGREGVSGRTLGPAFSQLEDLNIAMLAVRFKKTLVQARRVNDQLKQFKREMAYQLSRS